VSGKQRESAIEPITGVILAGGQNRRMGGLLKALLPWNGRPFIEHQLERMRKLCKEIIVVTNRPDALRAYADETVRLTGDVHPGLGPLAGLQTAFREARCETLWAVACDMPFISAAAAAAMSQWRKFSGVQAVIPNVHGRLQPLHGVYGRQCAQETDRLVESGERRLMRLFAAIPWREADESFFIERGIDLGFSLNINSPDQYEALCRGE